MYKVGLLVGRERAFPDALIAEINRRGAGVTAEYISLGGTIAGDENGYRVIVDRIAHEVTYYQPFLKQAILQGTYVINNPFWRIADDKFFGTALAKKLGVAVPRTVVLPNKSYPEGIVNESLINLRYPLDWDGIIAYVGLPAILKPHWGGGWKQVTRVNTKAELLAAYDVSGTYCMILQEFIAWQRYARCFCIGQDNIMPVLWDPTVPHHMRYRVEAPPLDTDLIERMAADARLLNQALGYDMNTVEFGVRDGTPYAIDFMNSAPDFDVTSLTDRYFSWVVNAMADLCISRALDGRPQAEYRWDKLLGT